MKQAQYTIHGINGPVVKVVGGRGLAMMDMVRVGDEGLTGEVVGVDRGTTTIQVYEDTDAGLFRISLYKRASSTLKRQEFSGDCRPTHFVFVVKKRPQSHVFRKFHVACAITDHK